uniref:Coatomer subunit gamma C-terminal domain-containing protein n=1 Tax=Bracon brevicornis TaxID=1563983 RepID=A0A6V7J347_9HYME
MEDLEITLADQMRGSGIRGMDFAAAWEQSVARGFGNMEDTFALGANVTTLEAAVQSLLGFLGLEPQERSDRVAAGATSHVLLLHGFFRGGKEIFARARLAVANSEVTMQLSVRSQDPDIAAVVLASVG